MRARHILYTCVLLGTLQLVAAGRASAQASIAVEEVSCFRFGDNQVVHATASGEPPGGSARLYFQWTDHPAYYWVGMEPDGVGRYWVTPPKPETRNKMVEYYSALVDANGREVARSLLRKVKVTQDCRVQLTPQQLGAAQNLEVGETSRNQQHNKVQGFLCDGVVTRIDPDGVRRVDELCRACFVAWWSHKELLVPLVAAGTIGTTILVDRPESSPSRP
jgi:hypothetical protein